MTRGELQGKRRRILSQLFEGDIPEVPSDEWGAPGSSTRLRKLAFTIASLTRNAKRRGPQMAQAVSDWESDLDHLHERYYVGKFGFAWPATGPKTKPEEDEPSMSMAP